MPASRAPASVISVNVSTCIRLVRGKCAKCIPRACSAQQRGRFPFRHDTPDCAALSGNEMAEAVGTHDGEQRGAWGVLAILTSINLLNYIDRFIFPAVAESIKHSALHPSDTADRPRVYGIPRSSICSPRRSSARSAIARSARDGWRRGSCSGAWPRRSADSRARCRSSSARASLVGIGEAAYSAISPAILADYFPERTRGRVFAIFFAATPVGAALGYRALAASWMRTGGGVKHSSSRAHQACCWRGSCCACARP